MPNISTKGLASFVSVKECLSLVSAYTDYYSNFDSFRFSDTTAQTRRSNPGNDRVRSNLRTTGSDEDVLVSTTSGIDDPSRLIVVDGIWRCSTYQIAHG